MAGPLEGIRVVDCSCGEAGARMTWLLADYGADVVRVEPPEGDPWRDRLAVKYAVYHRNKRSIELDLRNENGREALLGLLETADVFVETWRPGVAARLGLSYEVVHKRAPRLVYCSISGFGEGSDFADMPGYSALVHAATGMMSAQFGHREGPIFLGLPQASNGAAYMALIGVLAALYRREADGWGRLVESSLFDGVLAYMAQALGYGDAAAPVESGSVAPFGAPRFVTRTFLCEDDDWLGISTFGRGAFDRLMTVLGIDDRIPPQDGVDVMAQLSLEEAAIIFNEVPEIFLTRSRAAWLELLLQADIAAIPVLRPGEVFDEPQVVHNGIVVEVDDPVLGVLQQVGPAARVRGHARHNHATGAAAGTTWGRSPGRMGQSARRRRPPGTTAGRTTSRGCPDPRSRALVCRTVLLAAAGRSRRGCHQARADCRRRHEGIRPCIRRRSGWEAGDRRRPQGCGARSTARCAH